MFRTLLAAAALIVVLTFAAFGLGPGYAERGQNIVLPHAPYEIGATDADFHSGLFVADLHADLLLWGRSPLRRARRGHTDIPRLQDGGVALQVFAAVTKVPAGLNYETNTGDSDQLRLLALLQRWPAPAWSSPLGRALHQAERLNRSADRSPDLVVVRSRANLDALTSALDFNRSVIGGVLAIEGLHAAEGEIANIQTLYDAGYRMMGLHHFFDNALGGSLHGVSGAGLTDFGRETVAELDRLHVIIDVAHSSEAAVRDVLALTERAVVVSHTGLAGACDSARNISDALMQEIASRGGLIGVGFWEAAVCDITPAGVARAIAYGVELLGEDHIALGSDFDGATTTAFDASELAVLTQALRAEGLSDTTVAKVMGENIRRFLMANLPAE